MTCDEVELSLTSGEELGAAAREHLGACERCRAFQAASARLLADAALPEPSIEEKASLQGLAPRVLQEWSRLHRRRSFARRVMGLALAACVGAAVASAALLPKLAAPPSPSGEVPDLSLAYEPELVSSSDTDDGLEDFEVSWPSP